jgi:ElaB/YqjD/DUF883 family membrane-anchored ribosome-binding protein
MQANGKENWANTIEKARDHFNDGWKELAKAAEEAKERGTDAWAEAQKKGREAWVNAKAKGMESWEDAQEVSLNALKDARERSEEALQDAEKLVRKYPTRAVGLSLLVGAFIGVLLSKDRD